MKNFLIGALTVLLIGAVGYIFFQQKNSQKPVAQEEAVTETETQKEVAEEVKEDTLVGSDRDEHGCIGSAGYSWCEAKKKCLREWEEKCEESANEGISEAMAQKHGKNISEVTITITQESGNYVRGGVEFAPGGLGNAGMFLAVKTNGEWEIVYDGHGVPDCNKLQQKYNFPQDMLQGMCF